MYSSSVSNIHLDISENSCPMSMGSCSNSMSKVKNNFVICHYIFIVFISVTPSLRPLEMVASHWKWKWCSAVSRSGTLTASPTAPTDRSEVGRPSVPLPNSSKRRGRFPRPRKARPLSSLPPSPVLRQSGLCQPLWKEGGRREEGRSRRAAGSGLLTDGVATRAAAIPSNHLPLVCDGRNERTTEILP